MNKGKWAVVRPRKKDNGRMTTVGLSLDGKTMVYLHRASDPTGPSVTSRAMSKPEALKLAKRIADALNA
jgi:hypothetical protein